MLHAKKTEISSGSLGLWLVYTFTFTLNDEQQFWHKVTVLLFNITILRHTVFQDQKFLDIFPWFFLFLWLLCTCWKSILMQTINNLFTRSWWSIQACSYSFYPLFDLLLGPVRDQGPNWFAFKYLAYFVFSIILFSSMHHLQYIRRGEFFA